jgi:hypothetical protein
MATASGRVAGSKNPGFPWGQIGTAIYFFGFPLVLLVWVYLILIPFVRRKKAVGGVGVTTLGYKFPAVFASIIWYLGFFFAAFITFASVADKAFSGKEGASKTKIVGLILALIQWTTLGVLESNLITFQSGITLSETAFDLPDCVMQHVPGGGTTMIRSCPTTLRFEEIEGLAAATSSESFKTVRSSTSGNTTTTITRTWTRNVLWVCFRKAGEASILGFPVSAVSQPACGGYCCLSLERRQELGVINATAKSFLRTVSARLPNLTAQADQPIGLIDSTVKI